MLLSEMHALFALNARIILLCDTLVNSVSDITDLADGDEFDKAPPPTKNGYIKYLSQANYRIQPFALFSRFFRQSEL